MRCRSWNVWHNAQSTFKQSVVICVYSSASTINFPLLTVHCALIEQKTDMLIHTATMIKYEFQLNNVPKLELLKSLYLMFVMFVENISSRISFHWFLLQLEQPTATKFNFLVPKTCGFHFETIILVDALSRTPYTTNRMPHHTPRYSISFINSMELIMD